MCPSMTVSMTFFTDICDQKIFFTDKCVSASLTVFFLHVRYAKAMFSLFADIFWLKNLI